MRANHRSRTVVEDMIVESVDLLRPSLGKAFPLCRVVKKKKPIGRSGNLFFLSFSVFIDYDLQNF